MLSLNRLLDELERSKRAFDANGANRVAELLDELTPRDFPEAAPLVRFHETLLFLSAYPHNPQVKRKAEAALLGFGRRIENLRASGTDVEPLEEPEVSGIAGAGISAVFSYGLARDLVARHGPRLSIDWEFYEKPDRLGRALPRFAPLLAEDALVEAVVPYREWLDRAGGQKGALAWLMDRLAGLPFARAAEIYDSLELMLRWEFGASPATRTRARLPSSRVFYHDEPLIGRGGIVLADVFDGPPLPVDRLSRTEGLAVVQKLRDISAVRYRELHGFTFADPSRVLCADAGRGMRIYVTVVPAEHRLPLRAYHGGMFFKNGIPVGYVEGLSLFERMEVGFNLYYTFREGETAWLYGETLRLFRQLTGVERFAVDPYQIGHENEEAIASGAFWFYRKLGFRPVRSEQVELCKREERKMRNRPAHRSSAPTLRRLAQSPIIYETEPSHDWDCFSVRQIGLRVQERTAESHSGDPERMRVAATRRVGRCLGFDPDALPPRQRSAFDKLALAMDLVPDLERWPDPEKALAVRIIRAKAGADEGRYLRLMQRHAAMRAAFLELGSI